MEKDSEIFRERGGEREGREEMRQLNVPRPVVNSEWGRKTMEALILRSHSLSLYFFSSSLALHFSAK